MYTHMHTHIVLYHNMAYYNLGARRYSLHINSIAAPGYASGHASGTNRVRVRYESDTHRDTHEVNNFSVKLSKGIILIILRLY